MTAAQPDAGGTGRLFARFRAIILCAFLGLFVVALALVAVSARYEEDRSRRMLTELLRGHAFLIDAQAFAFHQAAAALAPPAAGPCTGTARAGSAHTTALRPVAFRPGTGGLRIPAAPELERLAPNLSGLMFLSGDTATAWLGPEPTQQDRADIARAADCRRNPLGSPRWVVRPDRPDSPGCGGANGADGTGRLRFIVPAAFENRSGHLILDLDPCALRRMNADLALDQGHVLLASSGSVIGAPDVPGGITTLAAAGWLDPETARAAADPLALPPGDLIETAGRLLFVQPMTHAPWALIVSLDAATVRRDALATASGRVGVLLVLIALTLALTVAITRRAFIEPARALVAEIAARGTGAEPPAFRPPSGWQPHFDRVRRVFQENAEAAALRQELSIAARMQASILPTAFPGADTDLGWWGRARPAREVGGDFFDIFEIGDGRIGMVIADVSGKGVPAALFMVLTRTLTRAAASDGAAPAEAVAKVNRLLARDNPETMFVTLLYAVIDPARGCIDYVNAGHNPPYILAPGAPPRLAEAPGGPALGVFDDVEFTQAEAPFHPGETLVLYTDGVTEAMNPAHEEYGETRLETLLTRLSAGGAPDPAQIAAAIGADVDAFAGAAPQADDITILAATLRRPPPLSAQMMSGPEEIAPFAERLALWGAGAGVPEEATGALSLALDELASNAFEHGTGEGTAPDIRITVTALPDSLDAELSDNGPEFDPFSAPPPDLDAALEDRSPGGLGVHFVRTVMDHWRYERRGGRNIVTLRKTLNTEDTA